MRAARFYTAKDIRIEDIDEPSEDLGPHQVLAEPRWTGICGTDLHEYMAGPIVTPATEHALTGATLPQVLGHEFSADVVAVGDAVENVAAGDRVSIMPLAYCRKCAFCVRGLNQLCTRMGCVGLSWPGGGGFSARVVVDDYQAWRLPDALSYEQGAMIEPAAVAAYGVARAGVVPGDRVLVSGSGPIGALTVLAAYAAGAGEVFVSEPNARRAAWAESLDTAGVLDPTATDVVEWLRDQTDGLGVDVAIECSGSEAGLQAAIGAVRTRGTVAQVGLHVKDAAIDPMRLSEREITLVGTWAYDVHEWPRYMAQVASGAFPVEKVITDKIGLDDVVSKGFDVLTDPSGDQIKILVASR